MKSIPGVNCNEVPKDQPKITPDTSLDHKGSVHVCAHHVKYSYWGEHAFELTDEIKARLETEAEDRAKAMITEGYVSGELNCLIGDDEEVRGWWEIDR
jgi:hypothetical protein